jgi:ABC-type amino acid transport substrate-binding protein
MNRLTLRRSICTAVVSALALVTATACGSSSGGSSADSNPYGLTTPGTVTAAITSGDYPFTFADPSGKPTGFLIDLNADIFKAMNLQVVYKTTTVQAGLPALTSGQYDMMVVGLVASAERKKSVGFTKPIFWGQNVIVTQDNATGKSIDDFAGKRVGAGANSTQADFVQKSMTKSNFVSEATDSAAVSQLLAGNVDAIVLGSTHVGQIFAQHPGKLKVVVTSPQASPGAEAVNKKLTKFTDAYNDELGKLADNGTFLKLYQKYFPNLPYPTQMYPFWPSIQQQIQKQGSSGSNG